MLPPRLVSSAAALAALTLGLGACGGDDPPATSTTTSGGGGNTALCANDPRADAYVVGLERASTDGSTRLRFVDADPAPPAKGTNTLTVAVEDADGQPIEDATLALAPFMPDHAHGSSVVPTAEPAGSPGTFTVSNVYLFMPGIWQLTFEVTRPGAAAESIVFTFCVEG